MTFLNRQIVIEGTELNSSLPRDDEGAWDGVESFLLALVVSGVITESEDPRVNEALNTAFDAIDNNS